MAKRTLHIPRRVYKRWQHLFRDYAFIVIGCALGALAYDLFLVPHKIPPGGVSSISMLFHHILHTPFGLVMLGLNIPLFILAIKNLGRMFGVRTLIGMALLSLFSDFFTYVLKLGSVTDSTLLATLYGGLLLGTGLGFVFRGGGSTGGTDIAGRLIAKYTNLSTGQGILITDAVIIAVFSIVFKSFEPALYGFIGLFISTKTVDAILEGRDYARAVYIFSNKSDELGKMILEDFGRGVTTLYGEGMHSGEKKRVLFCVATRKQIHDMRDAIRNIDRDAFVVVTNVHEVLGKGFRKRVG